MDVIFECVDFDPTLVNVYGGDGDGLGDQVGEEVGEAGSLCARGVVEGLDDLTGDLLMGLRSRRAWWVDRHAQTVLELEVDEGGSSAWPQCDQREEYCYIGRRSGGPTQLVEL